MTTLARLLAILGALVALTLLCGLLALAHWGADRLLGDEPRCSTCEAHRYDIAHGWAEPWSRPASHDCSEAP